MDMQFQCYLNYMVIYNFSGIVTFLSDSDMCKMHKRDILCKSTLQK